MKFRSFVSTAVILMMFALAATNVFSQTRDFDFGPDGRPVQVAGPGFGQATDQNGNQAVQAPVSQPTGMGKRDDKKHREAGSNFLMVLMVTAITVVIAALVIFFRRRYSSEEEEGEGMDVEHHPSACPPSAQSPAAPAPGATPSGHSVVPVIVFLSLSLFGTCSLRADSRTATLDENRSYPRAVAEGTYVFSTLRGSGLDGVTGCGISIPNVGCSWDHSLSSNEVVVRVTAGKGIVNPNGQEPARGTLRLVFSDGSIKNFPNFFAVGTTQQIGTAMLNRYVNPPSSSLLKPRVINRTIYRTDPSTVREVRQLREEWNEFRSQYQQTSPANQTASSAAVVQNAGPAPQAQSMAASAATAQAIINRLDQIQRDQADDRRAVNALGSQVVAVNQALVNGLGVVGGTALRGLSHKKDRCEALVAYQQAGIKVSNPEVLGCSKK